VNAFIQLPGDERRLYCEQAAARLGLPAPSVEKDFWVCWTLRLLFGLADWTGHLTFKGGTSLSKGWRLIERFSEDIDVVIDRETLGFGGPHGPGEALTRKQRQRRLEALKNVCQEKIRLDLLPALKDALISSLPSSAEVNVQQAGAEEDPDQQTILFAYPSALATPSAYLRRVVKIELGARSDTEPSASPVVQPYVAEALPELFRDAAFSVRAVAPRRTFWEKAFLLHEETFRPSDKPRRRQLARHYYDLWSLIRKGVGEEALTDPGLFDRVAEHRQVFFPYGWMDYTTCRPGAFRLLPPDSRLADWKRDYDAMQGEMFFGLVPSFEEILRVVSGFEQRFNTAGGPCCGSVQLNA
jgi:hypothetical protein